MKNSEWREQFLETVSNCSSEGKEAVDYIRAHKTHIGIRRARKSVGAFWTLAKAAYLNSAHYSQESSLANPNAWALLIHEVRHLQQGPLTALSIYGELDAWQYQLRVLKKLTGKQLAPAAGGNFIPAIKHGTRKFTARAPAYDPICREKLWRELAATLPDSQGN